MLRELPNKTLLNKNNNICNFDNSELVNKTSENYTKYLINKYKNLLNELEQIKAEMIKFGLEVDNTT